TNELLTLALISHVEILDPGLERECGFHYILRFHVDDRDFRAVVQQLVESAISCNSPEKCACSDPQDFGIRESSSRRFRQGVNMLRNWDRGRSDFGCDRGARVDDGCVE